MDKEYIVCKNESITLGITAGKVDSFRRREETTHTCRVYSDGKIGVAGALGDADEATLVNRAKDALTLEIPYACSLDRAEEIEVCRRREIIPEKEFVCEANDLLERISKECPRFAVSNKIILSRSYSDYKNSNGRHLVFADDALNISLLFQSRGSGNILDSGFEYLGRNFDPDAIVKNCLEIHDAFHTPVDIEEGEWPVVLGAGDLFETFLRNFTDEMYVSGASIVGGKLGQKIFSEKLTLSDDRNPETVPGVCFFDDEGQVSKDYRANIIDGGVLESVITSKNTAARFGLPVSRTSVSSYDGVPTAGFVAPYIKPTARSLADLVPGKAIMVSLMSGGDTTPDGHFASPVQVAFLIENGKLVGRLPELNVCGDFFKILGDDYIGAVVGDPCEDSMYCAARMKVTK